MKRLRLPLVLLLVLTTAAAERAAFSIGTCDFLLSLCQRTCTGAPRSFNCNPYRCVCD